MKTKTVSFRVLSNLWWYFGKDTFWSFLKLPFGFTSYMTSLYSQPSCNLRCRLCVNFIYHTMRNALLMVVVVSTMDLALMCALLPSENNVLRLFCVLWLRNSNNIVFIYCMRNWSALSSSYIPNSLKKVLLLLEIFYNARTM